MYKRTRSTVYFVWWPGQRVLKVGYSLFQRWRAFELRGAELLALKEFDNDADAWDSEDLCHQALRAVCRAAFLEGAEATALLGGAGGGWAECFRVPGDLMGCELLAFCDAALDELLEAA